MVTTIAVSNMATLTCSLSERAIKAQVRKLIFGNRTKCLLCGYFHIRCSKAADRYWCPRCRRRFSLISDTWLKGMKLPWQTFYLLLECWLHEYSVKQAIELCSLSRKGVIAWYRKFWIHIPRTSAYFQGTVEADESWFGYRSGARIKALWRKVKIPVLGLYERESGQLETKAVPKPTEDHLIPFVIRHVAPNTHIVSDSYRGYWQLPDLGYRHTRVDHYSKEYGPTNRLEGSWSVLKRRLRRMYYSVSRKYFPEYLCEITYRFNTRNMAVEPFKFLKETIVSNNPPI